MGRKPTVHQVINVADLRQRMGQRQFVDVDILLPPLEVIASRTVDEPVTGELTIESIERGVSVTGHVRFAWEGDCRRCLEPVSSHEEIDILEIFQTHTPDDEEINDLVDNSVDLVPLVRDTVLLSLPLAPLCREDCAGPDPDRYPAVTEDEREAEAAAAGPKPDPRWAALSDLQLDD